MQPLVIVFAKAPRPGFVKTRLGLEPVAAASLHTEFVSSTLKTVCRLRSETDLELSVDVPCESWPEFAIRRTVQEKGDLGRRLYSALERGLSAGHPRVLVLGSDSPTLPLEYVRFLLTADADVVLGPTKDGGYYGISCRTINPAIFDRVRWSSGDTLSDTIESVETCGLSCRIGPEWFDVDIPEDLLLLRKSGFEKAAV